MKLRFALAAATCLALPLAVHSTAQAQPVTGPYVSLGAGTSIQYPFNYSYEDYGNGVFSNTPQTGKFLTRPSYAGVASAGYGFGNGFRAEIGFDYYRNTVHKDDLNAANSYNFGIQYGHSAGQYSATGGETTYGPMANILYDISIGLPIYPYVGAGVGYQ
jgi:hypothetical protein